MLYIRSANNQLIPLESVAKITQGVGPLTVNHTGQLPSVTISFNLKPGVSRLLFSQLLTLYITPVFYIYMEKMRARFSDREPREPRKPDKLLLPEKQPVSNK